MKRQSPPLFYARTAAEVQELVRAGHDVNEQSIKGHTPVHSANNPSVLKELIRLGGDVNALTSWGGTPLHTQQDIGRNVATLISAGTDVNALDDYGDTALHWACSPAVVFQLLKAGANPNIRNKKGELPEVHYGTYVSSRAMTAMLKEVRAKGRLSLRSAKEYVERVRRKK
jgi:Notch-like protein